MIKIELTGQEEIFSRLQKISHGIGDFIAEATEETYEEVRKGAGKHIVTGRLENNVEIEVSRAKLEGKVYISDEGMMTPFKGGTNYAAFVLFGTRPHDIRPKSRSMLRWSSDGAFHFAGAVHHPGYKGDDFLGRAAERTFSRLGEIAERILND